MLICLALTKSSRFCHLACQISIQDLGQPHFDVLKTTYAVGLRLQVPAHNAQDDKVEQILHVLFPSIPSCSSENFLLLIQVLLEGWLKPLNVPISKWLKLVPNYDPPLCTSNNLKVVGTGGLPAFSSAEELHLVFLTIVKDLQGNLSISGLLTSLSIHIMCQNMEELHTFLDICTPQGTSARPLSKDGYSTIK